MCDPLSPLASVITVVGSATECIKVLVTFFRQFRNAPEEIRQWLTILESLRTNMYRLQQCGPNLDSRYYFSSHFRQRLLSFVTQLQVCSDEVARIDAELTKANPDGKKRWDFIIRKSWGRAKWAIIGEHKSKKLMRMINLYHFEFTMELSMVLL